MIARDISSILSKMKAKFATGMVLFVGAMVAVIFLVQLSLAEEVQDQKLQELAVQASTQSAVTTADLPDDASVPVQGMYSIDRAASSLVWSGSKTFVKDFIKKTGTIQIKSGEINYGGMDPSSGRIVIDMHTIMAQGEEPSAGKLTTHLKNEDFFEVNRYPEAIFDITGISTNTNDETVVGGNLTIKGTTQFVSFPVTIYGRDDARLYVKGTATIDRTQFGIKYGSDKFFDNLKDNVIADTFTLDMYLVANKK